MVAAAARRSAEGSVAVLLDEPPPSRGDIHFMLFGFPVRIHPLFWVVAFLLGCRLDGARELVTWVAAVLVSILIHEWGHALVMRACGLHPSITLHGLGGLTSARGRSEFAPPLRTREEVLISAAGPAAGFLLAAAVCGVLILAGYRVLVRLNPSYGLLVAPAETVATPLLTALVDYILFISVTWGLINLLPIYPLDGGQIARELLLTARGHEGLQQSLRLSLVAAAAMALVGLILWRDWFVALFFGYLAFQSYILLQAARGSGRPW
jgi:Zn-dependent protease